MLTEHDLTGIQTRTLTAVCMEDTQGYPDPLIYIVEAPVNASPDEITEMVIQERLEELGEELEEEIRGSLRVCLAWEGDPGDPVFDHRI